MNKVKRDLEDILWPMVFHKPKPNLPFKVEEDEINNSLEKLESLIKGYLEEIIGKDEQKHENYQTHIDEHRNRLRAEQRQRIKELFTEEAEASFDEN